ncbi:MAG: response regulator transcription factor [Proteobacteria bacterium]|nr:response regulator transcription factor [Pseudomonadota bacterium]
MKLLLIDDHPLLRAGMRFLLRSLDAGIELDEAGTCDEALELLAGRDYDLVLLDLMLPGRNGLSALAAIRDAAPGVPVVVVSGESDPGMVRAAIDGGAMGFIPKSSTPEVMIQALQLVLAHGIYLPPMVLEAAYTSSAPAPRAASTLPGLTPRQMDVLRGVIKGKANKAIAKELELSEGTVKAHLSAVFQALGVHSRTEAVYAAANQGLRLP